MIQNELIRAGLEFAGFAFLLFVNRKPSHQKLVQQNGRLTPEVARVILFHIAGILWLTSFAFPVHGLDAIPFLQSKTVASWKIVLFFTVLAATVYVGLWTAGRNAHTSIQASPDKISLPEILIYLPVRILFIYSYETWLRGSLLLFLLNALGIYSAILINVILYTFLHAFAGRKEIIGCIPFGLILCFFTLSFHALWPAVLLHVSLSLTYETKLIIQQFRSIKQAL